MHLYHIPEDNNLLLCRKFRDLLQLQDFRFKLSLALIQAFGLGQRLGTGMMSKESAREADPLIDDPEIEVKHRHTIFPVLCFQGRLAATDKILDIPADGVEEQGIDCEIATHGILFEAAPDIVTQDAAVVVLVIVILVELRATEGGDLDQGPAQAHVRQAKAAADQAAARKHFLDLFRGGAGGHVEVLGRLAQKQVPHAAANDIRFVAGVLEFLDDLAGVRAKLFEPDAVLSLCDGDVFFDVGLRFLLVECCRRASLT